MPSLQETEAYRYLRKPTGYHVDATPRETIRKINKELELVHHSLLAPWQKIDATSTFIKPKIDFALRTGVIEKKHLTETDKLTKRCAKSWMNLPQRASLELLYLQSKQGGADLLPLADMVDISTIAQGYKMLSAQDHTVRELAAAQLRDVTTRKIGRPAQPADLARYLSGDQSDLLYYYYYCNPCNYYYYLNIF